MKSPAGWVGLYPGLQATQNTPRLEWVAFSTLDSCEKAYALEFIIPSAQF